MTVILTIPDSIQIDTPHRGRVALRCLTGGSMVGLEKLRREQDATGFLLHGLALHILNPSATVEDLATWDLMDIDALARGWSRHRHAFDCDLDDGNTADAFVRGFDRCDQDMNTRMRDTLGPILESLQRQNRQLADILGPSRAMQQVVESLRAQEALWRSDVLRRFQQLQDSAQKAHLAYDSLATNARLAAGMTAAISQNERLHSFAIQLPTMSEALRLSTAYQFSLSRIAVDQPRWATTTNRLLGGIHSLSAMSGTLLDEWATAAAPVPNGSIAQQAPIAELYAASSTSAALVGVSIEAPPAMMEAQQETLTLQIEPALTRVDVGLIEAYRGAAGVIDRGGPDHVRHFAVSLRELLTHVIHQLAPDEELREWPEATPEDYHNGRPTRRLRLRYIFRDANSTTYTAFIDDDIERTIDMMDMLNADTHRLFTETDTSALRLVLRRVEGLLAILLEAAHLL